MIEIIRTEIHNHDFVNLVKELDAYLATTDGDEHDFYNQFNGIDRLDHVIVAYIENQPIACGAFKKIDQENVEIKRMYTKSNYRNQGVAANVLMALENWASELNYKYCILETGKRQVEAVKFYKKKNYKKIENYGQYAGMDNSLCFKKRLN